MKGLFIVFEGGEFAGKTTQSKGLAEYLRKMGLDVIWTKEPGGTPEGQKIRERLLHEKLDHREELELFFEDRRIHVAQMIKPAIESGKIVVCDRFSPSTIAYQGGGRELDRGIILQKDAEARSGIWPDKIILLDGDPEGLRERASRRGEKPTNFEKIGLGFHQRVRESFLKQAEDDPDRWCVLDASRSIGEIHEDVKKCVEPLISKMEK